MYNNLKKYKSTFILLVKFLIVSGAYYFISQKISNNDLFENTGFLTDSARDILDNPYVLFLLFLFTFFNWYLEILKWKTLVTSVKKITFFDALKQSFSSLTASLLTPNRIGEYGAKAVYYPKNKRYNILFMNFLGNINQMFMTVLFGSFGLFFLIRFLPISIKLSELQIFGALISFVLVLLFSLSKKVKIYLNKITNLLRTVTPKIHFLNLFYSFLRYLVFSHQFYFLLFFFGADLDYFIAMPLIFTMYLLASIIPSFVFFDWLIKGSVAVSLFSVFHINEMLILSITGIMWLANFAFPSLIGSYFVLTFTEPASPELEENIISI